MRIGIVGAGFWTKYQIAGWCEIPGVEIVAIANKTIANAEALAGAFGIPRVYANPEQMIDGERLDCLDIVTAVQGHAPAVMLAAQNLVPVICQKPMATSLSEAREMVRVCAEQHCDQRRL